MKHRIAATVALLLTAAFGTGPATDGRSPHADAVWDDASAAQQPRRRPSTRPSTRPSRRGPSPRPTTTAATRPTTTTAATQPTTKPAEKPDRYFALVGGVVHTVSGPVRRDVTILCKNGTIQAIGDRLTLPEDTEKLDAAGMHVYPGLIACDARGIVGREPPEDNTDVFGLNMTLALAGGLTTVVSGNTAAKTTYGTLEGHVVRKDLFTNLSFNNPSARRSVREALDAVRRYLREKEAYDAKKAAGDEKAKPPDENAIKGRNEQYYKLIKRETTAVVRADSQRDLVAVAALAQEYGIRVVVRGAGEGWTVPDRLGRADVGAIVTPRRIAPREERLNRLNGGSIENAAVLHRHGVDVAVAALSPFTSLGGLGGRDLLNLPMEAAFAVRGGMTEDAAVRSVTLDAARVLGIDDRVGSIDVGKDADFIVCDGELLGFFTTVQWTVVNGRIAYDKAAESLLAHVRPRTPTTQPAPFKFWPRPFKPQP